jgi:8-oxo-dGTP pyrophosphatase MutT (NUDIX family)
MSLITYTEKTPKIWYASGVIIFNHDLTKTIIVKTPTGNIGFPKGGKEDRERLHQTAHREVLEETGLKSSQYKHDNMLVGEKKGNPEKGVCTIYYFIAHVNKEIEDIKLKCCNDYELSFIDWMSIEESYKILCKRRQDILRSAHNYIMERNNNNTLNDNLFIAPKLKQQNKYYFRNTHTNTTNTTNITNNDKKKQLFDIMKLLNQK